MKVELRTRLTIFAAGTLLALAEIALAGLWKQYQPVPQATCELFTCVAQSQTVFFELIEE
ncbi:MAG: hypothetical protein AAFN07_07030 [Pseudomonadota bacterium]